VSTGATRELNLGGPLALENKADTGAVPMMRNAELVEVKGELKKINKQLKQLTDFKKQANMMFGGFFLLYNCYGILLLAVPQSLEVVTNSVRDLCTCCSSVARSCCKFS
jgi:hypothetical protein